MADELAYAGFPDETGLTVVARLYDDAGQVGADIATSEAGSTANYFGDVPGGTAAGSYIVKFFDGTTLLGAGCLEWGGSAEISLATIPQDVWAFVLEGTRTAQGFMRILLSSAAGVLTGANTTFVQIKDESNTKDRISATVDRFGNREEVVLDDTD